MFTDEDFRNKLIEVERENVIAEQDVISLRAALEQERKKVKYIFSIMRLTLIVHGYSAGQDIFLFYCCVHKSSSWVNWRHCTLSHAVYIGSILTASWNLHLTPAPVSSLRGFKRKSLEVLCFQVAWFLMCLQLSCK